jgi:hypothetical protein
LNRPLQILRGIAAELLRRDRLGVEIRDDQLGADQQPCIGKIAIRDHVGSGRAGEESGRSARHKDGGATFGTSSEELSPAKCGGHVIGASIAGVMAYM